MGSWALEWQTVSVVLGAQEVYTRLIKQVVSKIQVFNLPSAVEAYTPRPNSQARDNRLPIVGYRCLKVG